MTLRGLAALKQKVAPAEPVSEPVSKPKPVPTREKAERVLRIKAAVEPVLPQGAMAEVEWGRLAIIHYPFWEIVVDPDCKVAVLTTFTRKANDQGRTDAEILEAAHTYAASMRECAIVVEAVVRAKGAE